MLVARRPVREPDRIPLERIVPGVGWKLRLEIPEDHVIGADQRFLVWMLGTCLVTMAIAGMLAAWQGDVQTRLLRGLVAGTHRLSRDPDSALLELPSGVEERQVARAVDELTERVRKLAKDYESALEARTRDLSRANARLKVAEEYLKRAFRGMPAPVVATDLTGRVRLWNRAAERLTGIAEEEIFDRPLRILAPEGAEEMANLLLNRARIEGRVARAPLEHVDGVGYVIQLARQRRRLRAGGARGRALPEGVKDTVS
jgi:PAS domain S-box-containing protein